MQTSQEIIETQLIVIAHDFLLQLNAQRALKSIRLDSDLERQLGIDSLGKVELFHRIEKKFSIQLPESAMTDVKTLSDLAKLILVSNPSVVALQPNQHSPLLEASSIDVSSAKSLVEVLTLYAAKNPNRPHIYLSDDQGKEHIITYGQLLEEAQAVARGLLERNIQSGDTIAIMVPTSSAFFYSFFGALLAGAVPVPIYPPFRPDRLEEYIKREARILHNAQVRILITFSKAEVLSRILRSFVPSLIAVTTVPELQNREGDLPEIILQPDDPVLIQYTSGSTGDPKGVLLAQKNMLANIRSIVKAISAQSNDVNVSWLPLYHDMGLMSWIVSLYLGIPVKIFSPLRFLSRPEKWLWEIHYHQATLSGGPNFAYELCVKNINDEDIAGLDLRSWRFAFNGAEAVNPKTLARFYKKFAPYGFRLEAFAPVYGLAETTVALTFPKYVRFPLIDKIQRNAFEVEQKAIPSTDKDALSFVACGEPIPDHEIRIVNDAGKVLAERMVGNIQFKGPSSLQGYYHNPAATKQIYHEGWWDAGDLGYIADKNLFVTGRKKDLIIKGGRNIIPEEIEEIVSHVADIRKGCIVAFGAPDNRSGTEKLIVVAEVYKNENAVQQKIRDDITEKMVTGLGIPPDLIILVPPHTIPKTSSGKLQRSACKHAFMEGKLTQHRLPVTLQVTKIAFMSLMKRASKGLAYVGKLFYSLYAALLIFLTVPFIWLSLFIFNQPRVAKICSFWARNFLRLIGCPIHVDGKLPQEEPMIFVSNHASYVDSLILLGRLPSDALFIAKKTLLDVPILRSFVKKLCLTVDQFDFAKSVQETNAIRDALRQGKSVVIFPEGTFTYANGLRPFKLGAFILSAESGTPLCPISLKGTRTIMRERNLPRPSRVTLTIGNPIYPVDKEWNEVTRLHALVRAEIAEHCGEPVIDVIVAGVEGRNEDYTNPRF